MSRTQDLLKKKQGGGLTAPRSAVAQSGTASGASRTQQLLAAKGLATPTVETARENTGAAGQTAGGASRTQRMLAAKGLSLPGVQTVTGAETAPRGDTSIQDIERGLEEKRSAIEAGQAELKRLKEAYDTDPTQERADTYNSRLAALRRDVDAYDGYVASYKAYYSPEGYQRRIDAMTEQLAGLEKEIAEKEESRTKISDFSDPGRIPHSQTRSMDAQVKEIKALRSQAEELRTSIRQAEYETLRQRPDFEEKSKADPEKMTQGKRDLDEWATFWTSFLDEQAPPVYKDSGWTDPFYAWVNGNAEAGAYLKTQDDTAGADALGHVIGGVTGGSQEAAQMTPEEIATFNYLYATRSPEDARAYYEYVKSDLYRRQRAATEAKWAEWAKEDPLGASAFTVLTSPLKGVSYAMQLGDFLGDGKIDQNAPYNSFSYVPTAAREQVAQDIETYWMGRGHAFGGKALSFLYQTGMSMGDFAFTTAVSGGNETVALAIMGTSAAADATIEAKDRGLSDGQSFALGTIAGIAEVVTEKVSLEALLEGKWERGALRYIIKNAFTEGTEEVGSDAINLFADILIAQDKSQWAQAIAAYEADGKSESEAFWRAVQDQALSMGLDFLGGALSGGVLSGGNVAVNAAINYYQTGKVGKEFQQMGPEVVQAIIETGLESDPSTKSYQLAQKLQAKEQAGEVITARDLGKLYQENVLTVAEEERAEAEAAAEEPSPTIQGETDAPAAGQEAGGLSLPELDGPASDGRLSLPELRSATEENGATALEAETPGDASEATGSRHEGAHGSDAPTTASTVDMEQKVKAAFESAIREGNGRGDFVAVIQNITEQFPGEDGEAAGAILDGLVAPDGPYGVDAEGKVYRRQAPGTTENLNGGIENAQADAADTAAAPAAQLEAATGRGDQVLDGNVGRVLGIRAGEQGGGLETSPVQAAGPVEQGRIAVERQNHATTLRRQKVSSREGLGLSMGTDAPSVTVLEAGDWDAGMRVTAERVYQETGREVTYVLGSIPIQAKNEEIRRVRGVYAQDGRIILQADHMRLSTDQIADHEIFHHKAAQTPGLIRDIEAKIQDQFETEEFKQVVTTYIEKLRGVIDLPADADGEAIEAAYAEAMEEIFADAYAGINAFGAHAERYNEVVETTLEERGAGRQRQETAAATDRRTGPPQEAKYSQEGEEDSFSDEIQRQFAGEGLQKPGTERTIEDKTGEQLTDEEEWALLSYKSSESYKLNAALWDDRPLDQNQYRMMQALDRALEKLPIYRGLVYRRIDFSMQGPEALEEFLAKHQPGTIIQYPAYTSSSTSEDGYTIEDKGRVTLVIQSETGRNLEGYGNNSEQEVLFPRESRFWVERVEADEAGRPVIYMREVMEDGIERLSGQLYSAELPGNGQVPEMPEVERIVHLRDVPKVDPGQGDARGLPRLRDDGIEHPGGQVYSDEQSGRGAVQEVQEAARDIQVREVPLVDPQQGAGRGVSGLRGEGEGRGSLTERGPREKFSVEDEGETPAAYNRTAVLEEETVDRYLEYYAARSTPNYAQAYIAYMSPEDFLKLTTSREGRGVVEGQSKPLDVDEFRDSTRQQPMQLRIDHETGEVLGHEGRHRAVALENAGVERVPVLLFDTGNKYTKEAIDTLTLTGQDFGATRSEEHVDVQGLLPFNYANRDAIVERFTRQPAAERIAEQYGRETVRYSTEDEGEGEERKKERKRPKAVAPSKPIIAKADLRRTLLSAFSIPDGSKADVGAIIDGYADRLLREGSLTEEARKDFFDRMYSEGVMTVEPDEFYRDGRQAVAGRKIFVNEGIKADFGDDWNDFRRRAFGAGVYLTNDMADTGVDVWNMELAEMLPGVFDPDETDGRSILERIVQLAEEGKDEKVSLAEYTAMLAKREFIPESEFLDNMERQMDWALRAFAEKADLEIKLRERTGVKIAQERAARVEMAERQRERQQLRDLQQRTLKQLQWLSKNRFRAPEELKATWDEVLGDIDIYAVGAANELHWSKKYGATWRDLAAMYKAAKASDPNFLPSAELERIVARLDGDKIADMDVGALQDLYKAAIGLRTEFYNRNNVINDETRRLFAEVYAEAKTEIETAEGGFTGTKRDAFLNMEHLTPMNFLERMAGWRKDGTWMSMARQLEQGERTVRDYKVRAQRTLEDFLTERADWVKRADGQGKDAIWYEVEVPELLELGMGDKPIFGDTVKVYMTPAQKVQLYLESKNTDNLRHMTGGRTFVDRDLYAKGKRQDALAQGTTIRLAPETVKALVSDLTEEEMELARLLDGYYNQFAKDQINRVSNILYGYDKAQSKNYAPIFTNQNYTTTTIGVFDVTAEGVGHMKARQYAVNPSYNLSAFDAFERHVDQTSRFIGMAIPARNWQTLLNWREKNNSTGDVITHKWGEDGKQYIDNLLNELQGGRVEKRDTTERILDTVLSRYISSVFGFNPSIVLKQSMSFPLAGAYLGWENIPNIGKALKTPDSLINTYTSELAYRLMGYATPETAELKNNPSRLSENRALKFTFGGGAITAMDGWTVKSIWAWAENAVRRDNPELEVGTQEQIEQGESPFYKEVASRFEEAVSRSQPMYDIMHRAEIMRSRSKVTRALTLFKTVPIQQYNMLRQTIGEAQQSKRAFDRREASAAEFRRARGKAGRAVLGVILAGLGIEAIDFLNALLKNRAKRYRDDDGELTWQSAGGQALTNFIQNNAGMIAGGDILAEYIGSLVTGDTWYGVETPGITQIVDLFEDGKDAFGAIEKFVEGGYDVVSKGGDFGEYLRRNGSDYLGELEKVCSVAATYLGGMPANNIRAYALGALSWVSPEFATAYEDATATANKQKLSGLNGGALKTRMGDILDNRLGEVEDETVEILAALYADGYTETVPSDTPASVSVNGEDRKLGAYQKQFFDRVWRECVALDDLVGSTAFRQADDEYRAKMVKTLYDYGAQRAKTELFADYAADKWVAEAAASGNVAEWIGWKVLSGDNSANFAKFKGAGLTNESALDLAEDIGTLTPGDGHANVTDMQKLQTVVDSDLSEREKLAAIGTILGTEMETESGGKSQYALLEDALDQGYTLDEWLKMKSAGLMTESAFRKVNVGADFGIDTDLYIRAGDAVDSLTGGKAPTQDEAARAINSMLGLSNDQKAVLWQIQNKSWSSGKNPFSPSVGAQVKTALEDSGGLSLPRLGGVSRDDGGGGELQGLSLPTLDNSNREDEDRGELKGLSLPTLD